MTAIMAIAEHEPALERPPWTGVLHEWVTTVDHKKIGIMYILLAVVFLVIGGAEALAMRLQLLWPEAKVLPPDFFNQMMTMHGSTMFFLFLVTIISAWSNYILPLALGSRDPAKFHAGQGSELLGFLGRVLEFAIRGWLERG